MKNFMRIFFSVCFSVGMLQAYDTNSTVIAGNTTVYNILLKKIDNEKNATSEVIILRGSKGNKKSVGTRDRRRK